MQLHVLALQKIHSEIVEILKEDPLADGIILVIVGKLPVNRFAYEKIATRHGNEPSNQFPVSAILDLHLPAPLFRGHHVQPFAGKL